MPQVIYIAGYGRSGSTILDTLLGNHPLVFGGGELTNCFAELAGSGRCSCGETYAECWFWQEVMRRLQDAGLERDLDSAHRLTRKIEARSTRALLAWNTSSARSYGTLWRALLEAISHTSHRDVIVDSSKSTRSCTQRAMALARLCGLDIRLIHLVRDPRAIMWSILRGSNRKLERGQPAMVFGGVHRALFSWIAVNLSVHVIYERDPGLEIVRIRYEDLVANPVPTLQAIGKFLDIDVTPIVALIIGQKTLAPGHGLAGNRTRRQGTLQLLADEEWKEALPAYSRRLARLSWPLARRYGYVV